MSEHHTHGATTVRASKGGGGGKWLLGGVAAIVLLGGGYWAWKNYAPSQTSNTEIAYNDPYASDPLRAGPMAPEQNLTADATPAESAAAPADAETPAARPARRSTTRAAAAPVPEETIGVTPVNLTTSDSDEIVVPAPHRPVWTRAPSQRRLSAMYPARALERGREGEASLHCTVLDNGALDCVRVSETPGGFGNAALRVSRTLRHSLQLADGSNAVGTPVNLHVVFRMPEETRRG